jgi:hypothetical protein
MFTDLCIKNCSTMTAGCGNSNGMLVLQSECPTIFRSLEKLTIWRIHSMPSPLQEQLQAAIKGVNDQVEQSRDDLMRQVSELSDAVAGASGDEYHMTISQVMADIHGSTFLLWFVETKKDSKSVLGQYYVPITGYPIRAGGQGAIQDRNIASSEELAEHFKELVSSPSSPLVVLLAYRMRARTS